MIFQREKVFLLGTGGVVLVLLFFLSRRNYLLFHSLVELLAILTGFSMFLFAVATAPFGSNAIVQKLGWLYLAVASVDVLHTLSYKGMGVFPGYTANLPTQFWILGRFLECGGLASMVLFPQRSSVKALALGATIFAALGTGMIFQGIFPACFLEGKGLTPFKITSEYFLIALFFVLSLRIRRTTDSSLLPFRKSLLWALLWSALAEFSFTLYTDVYGFFNSLGHLFRFLSYFVLLQGILVESIRKPFDILLAEVQREREQLEEVAKRDALTGLFNRHFFNQWVREHAQGLSSLGFVSTLVFLDVDGLKEINDAYGHLTGDKVLSFIAQKLKENLRKEAFIFRYGGDEFVVVFPRVSLREAQVAIERVQSVLATQQEFPFPVSFSFGVSELRNFQDVEKILAQADQEMYVMKKTKLRM